MAYNTCNVDDSCLTKIIQIKNPCLDTPILPQAGTVVMPSALVPEFTWNSASKITDELAKGYDFAVKIKIAAIDTVLMDIRTMLLENKYCFSTLNLPKVTYPQNIDSATCAATPAVSGTSKYRGVSVQLKRVRGTLKTVLLSRLEIISKQIYLGFTFYLNCYNFVSGAVTLRTYTVDLAAGSNDLLALAGLTRYDEEGISRIDIFYDNSLYPNICNTAQGRNVSGGCSCNSGTYKTFQYADNCLAFYQLTGTSTASADFTQKTPSTVNNNAYGFIVTAACFCSIENLLCHVAVTDPKAITPLLVAKFGQLFCEQLAITSRMNCFVLLNAEEFKSRAERYETRYNAAYNTMLATSKSYFQRIDPSCLSCNENIKFSSNF